MHGLGTNSVVVDPTNGQIIYAGTTGGVYKTTTGGSSWVAVNSGPSETYVSSIAIDPTNSHTIYAGTYWPYKSSDGGTSWTLINSAPLNTNAYSFAIDPTNSQIIYAGTQLNGIYKTTNGGSSWSAVNSGIANTSVWALAIDPTNTQTIYAGTSGGAYKTTNGGSSWTAVNSGMTNTQVNSLAIDPTNTQIVYAGTNSGVYKTTNGGTSWTAVNSGMSGRSVNSLAIDPTNSQTIYAGTSGGVYKTTNSGTSWTAVNSGMSNATVYSLAIDPTNSQTIYAGTGNGVYKTLLSDSEPAITGSSSAYFTVGTSGSFKVTSSGWPAPEFSVSGTLPSGITFNTSTGTFSGTPSSGSVGTYQVTITATNGIPSDDTQVITITVLPASSLSVAITSPAKGAAVSSLTSITGTASGSGLTSVQVQVTDGTYYLQSSGTFSTTAAWLTASGTTSWSLNTSSVSWIDNDTYTISARAVDSAGNYTNPSLSSESFSISVPTSQTNTTLSLTFNPTSLRAGGSVTISGTLVDANNNPIASQSVKLYITPPSTTSNPNPTVTTMTLTTNSSGNFSSSTQTFSTAGVYMVEGRFDGTTTLAASSTSQALDVTSQSGYAIIVTGKDTNSDNLTMHTASTDAIYDTLINKRGFLSSNITYLGTSTLATGTATRQNLQTAITSWAAGKLAASPGPLYLIMVDHGAQAPSTASGGFELGSDTITPSDLSGWLSTLESSTSAATSSYNRFIIIGACYSGQFIPTLSKTGRVIITSAASTEQDIAGFSLYNSTTNSWATNGGGDYFIDSLFSFLGRGDSFNDAFTEAVSNVSYRDPRSGTVTAAMHSGVYDTLAQHPLLDDNGDGTGSYALGSGTADGGLSDTLSLGVGDKAIDANPADITAVTPTTLIPAGQTTATSLWLTVNDSSRVAKAWVEITSNNSTITHSSGSGQIIPTVKTVPLYYDGTKWQGSNNFSSTGTGTYNLIYYTQDNQTSEISPAGHSIVYMMANASATSSSAAFTLTSPTDGSQSVPPVFAFSWQEYSSTNSITYTLKVSNKSDFSNIIYTKQNIPVALSMMPGGALVDPSSTSGSYYCQNGQSWCYWKVDAIDSAGNVTESNTQSFSIDVTNGSSLQGFGGYITDSSGNPINGPTVKWSSSMGGGNTCISVKTGNAYACTSVSSGTITATVSPSSSTTVYQQKSVTVPSGDMVSTGKSTPNFNITLTPTSSAQTCTAYTLSVTTQTIGSSGGNGSVTVTATPSGCTGSWTATSNSSWLTITSGSSGTTSGTVSYTVTANTSTNSRTGTITIAGQTLAVTESGVVNSGPNYTGYLDQATCTKISGWAYDSTNSTTSITVDIYDGSTKLTSVTASTYRADLASYGGGYHGFSYSPGFSDGIAHTIYVYYSGTTTQLGQSPMTTATCTSGGSTTKAKSKIGIYRNGAWYLDYPGTGTWAGCATSSTDTTKDECISWGWSGATPVVGDWNADGKTNIGAYGSGTWLLDYPGTGTWAGCGTSSTDTTKDTCLSGFGWLSTDVPVVGDWNGDGRTKIGIYRNGAWYLDYPGTGAWVGCGAPADPTKDACYSWGWSGATPVVGDWNGDGKSKIGVYGSGVWYLDYPGTGTFTSCGAPSDTTKAACYSGFGWNSTDVPVVGDWSG
ncbi:MAG: putative Ig domain-containing protein, partial [Nitrospirae bacterium]|nr:putative Ig domain-containing protein [Nitrospirota bacterium]